MYKIIDKTVSLISKVKPKSPDPFVIATPGMELKVTKNSAKDIVNKSVETSGGTVQLPQFSDIFPDEDPSLADETIIFEVSKSQYFEKFWPRFR